LKPFATIFLLLLLNQPVEAQALAPSGSSQSPGGPLGVVFNYLSMAGTAKAADFKPLTQRERNDAYLKSLINPVMYFKASVSAAIDYANDKPHEWDRDAAGYGRRFANITGQYGIQRTVTYGISSLLHEDNRYFGSGKKRFWRRTGYAISTSLLARHDDGRRYPSVSLIGGWAAAAFISRSWQPPSTHSAGDGAVSFGYSMGYNVLACTIKEFLPDLVRPFTKRNKVPASSATTPGTVR